MGNPFLDKMPQRQLRHVSPRTGVGLLTVLLILGVIGGVHRRVNSDESPSSNLVAASAPNPEQAVVVAQVNPQTFRTFDQTRPAGIRQQQRYVALGADRFPVFSLELDLRNPQVEMRPIWSNSAQMQGTRPLAEIGPLWRAFAAINGGFFNRKNQLPLGAIRREGNWYSGPILNRGAIAWDENGTVQIGRLSLQETVLSETGQRVFISHLNSGYVQAGVARYTPEWGPSYQPLTDNETIITVQNNQVTRQEPGGLAVDPRSWPIPIDGFLLVIRARAASAAGFPVGRRVTLQSQTIPANFAQFPHILGAGPLLLQNGQVVLNAAAEKFSPAFAQQAASRSFIGQTAQGKIVLGVVHNRPDGKGPTLPELAELTQRLGLVHALNLDGGSSSSLLVNGQIVDRDPRTAARIHNGLGIYVP
ncbi:MAG: phosphodiester glycosidase family protein [Spirulina sp. SIO3F2]|nr:phosphodiester glycosidase family protein [Spirulina sp. SIO3F2]